MKAGGLISGVMALLLGVSGVVVMADMGGIRSTPVGNTCQVVNPGTGECVQFPVPQNLDEPKCCTSIDTETYVIASGSSCRYKYKYCQQRVITCVYDFAEDSASVEVTFIKDVTNSFWVLQPNQPADCPATVTVVPNSGTIRFGACSFSQDYFESVPSNLVIPCP
jgi:hypothetical protein